MCKTGRSQKASKKASAKQSSGSGIIPSVNVFFDTETNGLPRENGAIQPAIMQIVIFNQNGESIFSQYVIPYDGLVAGAFIHGISQETLDRNNALSMRQTAELIKTTLRRIYGRTRINWVAYNTFGFDQSVLEANFKAVGIKMPINWYFSDLLPIVKELYPDMRPNFKLGTVYRVLNDISEEDYNKLELHNADTDVMCLHSIYLRISQDFPDNFPRLFRIYTRPLLSNPEILNSHISVLNGYNKKIPFESFGFTDVSDFMSVFQSDVVKCDVTLFKAELSNKGLKCNGFITNNIANNINSINSLSK
jgi:DNA polymerase III epsilon subunit-like protein